VTAAVVRVDMEAGANEEQRASHRAHARWGKPISPSRHEHGISISLFTVRQPRRASQQPAGGR
jgi:hypothetical protein